MNFFLIIIFGLASVFSLIITAVLFHHFKKFSIPEDPIPMKILKILKRGIIVLIFLSFLFLIILFL